LQDDDFNLGRLILYIKNRETKKMKYAENNRFVIRCLNLFLLVVDLPNGSDFPKPVGNTAIQYFLSMRHSRIVLSYSSTHQCQIVVKYMYSGMSHRQKILYGSITNWFWKVTTVW
jgi:hypothetical protein